MGRYLYLFFICISITSVIHSQQEFNPDIYKQFLQNNQNLSSQDLLKMHPAGVFLSRRNFTPENAFYFDSIDYRYQLTEAEKSLIKDNGFMVTERLSRSSFGDAFLEIWHKDLPVFVSTDAILHSLHMSYDYILWECELNELIPRLKPLLDRLHEQVPILRQEYASVPGIKNSLMDLDLYLTVARKFFDGGVTSYYSENVIKVNEIIALINKQNAAGYKLFGDSPRTIDFSQFKVRGHYTDPFYPELAKYFQTMIWLGRTELYLLSPKALEPRPSFSDIMRQSVCTFLLHKAAEQAGVMTLWKEIDSILQFFVGESDNVTLDNVTTLKEIAAVNDPSELLDSVKLVSFQEKLINQDFAYQKILSQIIMTGINSADSIVPASAFMLFGQRFIVDSYVTAQVVFDRIVYNNYRVKRMVPSTLDILFALGNDAAGQLLQPELDKYHYSTNLAALRYLVDSYQPEFWKSTMYNGWLNSIRSLNPPDERLNLPEFMQTAAYWQEKMNTQLASWAQLRHDNLLYAKQSYTGGVVCSYPYSYVEPIPEFYEAVKQYCKAAGDYFRNLENVSYKMNWYADNYFAFTANICDTLKEISLKEINNIQLSDREKKFLSGMLYTVNRCGDTFDGWYPKLFVEGDSSALKADYIVADFHTTPTDEFGAPVGWVLHAGTGPVNLGLFIAKDHSGRDVAYVGPVLSYYEHMTKNFFRFSDEEWKDVWMKEPSVRPSFVNSYLADAGGGLKPAGISLVTDVRKDENDAVPASYLMISNYPNPFNASTTFRVTIPADLTNSDVRLRIYNIQGELVKEIINETLPSGNYFVRWNGTTNENTEAASGVYLYNLQSGVRTISGKMTLLK